MSWGGSRIRGRGRRAVWDGAIEVEGAKIERAETVAFDSPADGILEQGEHRVTFRSRTTGDDDGIDLWLDRADQGTLRLVTGLGTVTADLATLGVEPQREELGGLDLHAVVMRYPEAPIERAVSLTHVLPMPAGKVTPVWVKAIQTDGHLAWASPIYVG